MGGGGGGGISGLRTQCQALDLILSLFLKFILAVPSLHCCLGISLVATKVRGGCSLVAAC